MEDAIIPFKSTIVKSLDTVCFCVVIDADEKDKEFLEYNLLEKYVCDRDKDKMNFICQHYQLDWEELMYWASSLGHLHIVPLCQSKGVNRIGCLNHSMRCAAKNGHLSIVQYFISQGADSHRYSRRDAFFSGHDHIVDFFNTL